MTSVKNMKQNTGFVYLSAFFLSLLLLLSFAQPVLAEGVFEQKKKAKHALFGADLNRLKAEHQLKFGKTKSADYKSNNPWDKKKKKNQRPVSKAEWGQCRDYALHKRNRCYREGRNAYRCEQMYETRARLCDNDL